MDAVGLRGLGRRQQIGRGETGGVHGELRGARERIGDHLADGAAVETDALSGAAGDVGRRCELADRRIGAGESGEAIGEDARARVAVWERDGEHQVAAQGESAVDGLGKIAGGDEDERQRREAQLPWAIRREDWHYVPRSRPGVPLGRMSPPQTAAAWDLLGTLLSERGREQVRGLLRLEGILGELTRLRASAIPETTLW